MLYLLLTVPGLAAQNAEHVAGNDFERSENREAYLALGRVGLSSGSLDLDQILVTLDTGVRAHVELLLRQHQGEPSLSLEQANESLAKVLWRARSERNERLQREVRSLILDAREQGDAEAVLSYTKMASELVEKLREIDRQAHALTMAGRWRNREARW
jgi:hypothetical protein